MLSRDTAAKDLRFDECNDYFIERLFYITARGLTPPLSKQPYQEQRKIDVMPVANSVLKMLSIKHVPTSVPS